MLFGEPPISVEALATKLRIMIPQLAKQRPNPDKNKAYTWAVKEALRQIGEELGLRSFFTGAEPGMKEFMVDVVWWRKSEAGESAVLGVESEWGNPRNPSPDGRAREVMEDFEKLTCFKAPMKVLLFCADNPRMRQAMHSSIAAYLRNFAQHIKGEQYLFMEFAQGRCFSYAWEADQNGRCPGAALRALDDESAAAVKLAASVGA